MLGNVKIYQKSLIDQQVNIDDVIEIRRKEWVLRKKCARLNFEIF